MTKLAGSALALLTLCLAGSAALAQTRPWPTDPPAAQPQSAPWPSSPPQQAAPWPGGGSPGQPAAMTAPPPMTPSAPPPGAGGPPGQPPPCIAKFMDHRTKVEKAAAATKAAGERKATREEMCKYVTAYFNAETQWIKYTKDNGATCGIPPEIVKQIEGAHARTGNIRKQLCTAGPGGGGPPAPSLSDALGTTQLPTPETAKTGRGTFDTLTGNALRR